MPLHDRRDDRACRALGRGARDDAVGQSGDGHLADRPGQRDRKIERRFETHPELERHQGARLQVTGTIIPPASSGRGTGGAATETGIKRIEVESFKILADHCTAQ